MSRDRYSCAYAQLVLRAAEQSDGGAHNQGAKRKEICLAALEDFRRATEARLLRAAFAAGRASSRAIAEQALVDALQGIEDARLWLFSCDEAAVVSDFRLIRGVG